MTGVTAYDNQKLHVSLLEAFLAVITSVRLRCYKKIFRVFRDSFNLAKFDVVKRESGLFKKGNFKQILHIRKNKLSLFQS